MTTKKDYYEILGIPRTASEKEIKAAYRKLARKYHPDVNPGDKASEDRFKEVGEAFAVLGDTEKRATYDRGGHEAFAPGFDPFESFRGGDAGGFGGAFTIEDLFDMFGGGGSGRRGRTRARRGQDLQFEASIPFVEAVRGSTLELNIPRNSGHGVVEERVKVRIPPGIDDGGQVRIPGKGGAAHGGGPAGDAYLHIRVTPHPLFRREGRDIHCDVPVGSAKASLGGTVDVPTLDGRATITLPAGTRSGQKMRLKGRGVPAAGGRPAGDLIVVIQIAPPRHLDDRSRELLEELARINPDA